MSRSRRQPTGMLDAVLKGRDDRRASRQRRASGSPGAIRSRSIRGPSPRLSELSTKPGAAPIVMPVTLPRSNPYIHFAARRDGAHRHASCSGAKATRCPIVGESDAGLFSFSRDAFLDGTAAVCRGRSRRGARHGNAICCRSSRGSAERSEVVVFPCVDEMEAVGINTPEELKAVEGYLARRQQRVLSIVIPAYNEERFIGTLLDRIKAVDLVAARPRQGNHRRRRLLDGSDGGDRRAARTA